MGFSARTRGASGARPCILDDLGGQGPTGRPWESGELDGMTSTPIEDFDDGRIFRERWKMYVPIGSLPEADRPPDRWGKFGLPSPPFAVEEDPEETAYFLEQVAPWGVPFPGLALAERIEIDQDVYQVAIESTQSGRIGLVPVSRPADIPYRVGWQGPVNHFMDGDGPTLLSVMMRSWEDRFDARLFRLGFDTMQFLVQRPPRSESSALAVAAEHFAFAGQDTVESIRTHASHIRNSPKWDFWWD